MFSEIMSSNTPDPDYRNYTMPPGDLNRTPSKPKQPDVRVNGKIRAREVRVIGEKGEQIGVMSLTGALALAKVAKLDLVQITSNIEPPVCRLVDFGKYLYELSRKGTKSD
jgi:translation initiation factor IF-3